MKFLTLLQPWASLLFRRDGNIIAKQFETRSWQTPYRGIVGVTSSKRFMGQQRAAAEMFGMTDADCPAGCLIGFARIDGCFSTSKMTWLPGRVMVHGKDDYSFDVSPGEHGYGDFSLDRFAWRLTEQFSIPELHSIETKGKLQLWENEQLVERIKALAESTQNQRLTHLLKNE